jgi:hypothetical protein
MSVPESLEDLGDPHDVYQRKLKKGVHSTEISYLSYSCALALDQSLDRFIPRSSPSEIVHLIKSPAYWVTSLPST